MNQIWMDNEGNGESEARDWEWIGTMSDCQISPFRPFYQQFACEITVLKQFGFIQERGLEIPEIDLRFPEIGKGPGGYVGDPSEYTVPIIAFDVSTINALTHRVKQ